MAATTDTRTAAISGVTEQKLRGWLALVRQPHRLEGPDLEALLALHGRVPAARSDLSVGQAAAELFTETIEAMDPGDDKESEERLPYLVLKTCFLDGAKLWQAANMLGISERQTTRERTRSIRLLRAELLTPSRLGGTQFQPEPVPAIQGFLARPSLARTLQSLLEQSRLIWVHGPAGAGKSSLVADLATRVSEHTPTWWYRFRIGLNDSVEAMLFELGEYLRSRNRPELALYIAKALPSPSHALGTRLALKGLSGPAHLLVLDDFHVVDDNPAIATFLEEAVARLPALRVVAVGRHRNPQSTSGATLEIPAFTRSETGALLGLLGIDASPHIADSVQDGTEGIPHLIKLAAAWLKTTSADETGDELQALNDREEVQEFLLDTITELMGRDDRTVLDAASVFRDRFTDDALAFVADRTRGEIQDASSRFVRAYVATRSRGGDVAFFHTSVRDYLYNRIDVVRRAEFHQRAAHWYRRNDNRKEAAYHQQQSDTKP